MRFLTRLRRYKKFFIKKLGIFESICKRGGKRSVGCRSRLVRRFPGTIIKQARGKCNRFPPAQERFCIGRLRRVRRRGCPDIILRPSLAGRAQNTDRYCAAVNPPTALCRRSASQQRSLPRARTLPPLPKPSEYRSPKSGRFRFRLAQWPRFPSLRVWRSVRT